MSTNQPFNEFEEKTLQRAKKHSENLELIGILFLFVSVFVFGFFVLNKKMPGPFDGGLIKTVIFFCLWIPTGIIMKYSKIIKERAEFKVKKEYQRRFSSK